MNTPIRVWLSAVLLTLASLTGRPVAAENGPEIVLQTGHALNVQAIALSHDGQHLLTGSQDGTAILWDARTGQQLRTLKAHRENVASVAISPDGQQGLTGSMDGTAILWELRSGKPLRTFKTPNVASEELKFGFWAVAFSPDGKQALTASLDVNLWDLQSGQLVRTFHEEGFLPMTAAFCPKGCHLIAGSMSDDRRVIVWDVASGNKQLVLVGHTDAIDTVAFSPDHRLLASGSTDKTAILWDAKTGQKLRTFDQHADRVSTVAFSPDSRQLLIASWGPTASLWDLQSGQVVRTFRGEERPREKQKIWTAAFRADGQQIVAGLGDNGAGLWDCQTGRLLRTFRGAGAVVGAVAFAEGGKVLLTSGLAGFTWDLNTGQPVVRDNNKIVQPGINSAVFGQDGRHALVGYADRSAVLYDLHSGQRLQTFPDCGQLVVAVACSPNGRWALTAATDQPPLLWNIDSAERFALKGHTGQTATVAFSPDGRRALTSAYDQTVILWDVQTRQPLQTLRVPDNAQALAASPDGKQILTGLTNGSTVLWDSQSGQMLRTFSGHMGMIWSVAFSEDGTRAVTGAWDAHAILWDVATGKRLRQFQGHTNLVTSAKLSPDGRHLLTTSFDGTTRLWDAASGTELAKLIGTSEGGDWLVITPEGLFDGSAGGRQKVSYRVGEGLNVVPVDRFFQDFYRPGLLASLWQQGPVKPKVELFHNQPPLVRIVSPAQDGAAQSNRVTLEVEVVDQGGGVQGPWLMHNGARTLARGQAERQEKTVKRRFEVALIEGENRFEVQAASADGSWEAEPAVRVLRYESRLQPPVLRMVAVGISRYAEPAYRLRFAREDAETLAELFRRRGGTLYQKVEVTPLLDSEATGKRIRQTMEHISQQANPQDTLILFLAGHGAMVGQRYYFIPYDFHNRPDKRVEEDIRQQGLPVDVLGDFLAMGPALKRMLILDTCASGGAVDLFQIASRNPFALRGEIERLSRSQGVYVIAASAASEDAKEAEDLGHGVLTYALLAGLKAVDAGPLERISIQPSNPNQVIDVLEWFSFASGHVPRLTEELCGQEQSVHMAGRGSSFPVLPLGE